jgi:hypothetical protein
MLEGGEPAVSYEATVSAEQWYREESTRGIDSSEMAAWYRATAASSEDDGYLP